MTPANIFLFLCLKQVLKALNFADVPEIQQHVTSTFTQLYTHCKKCVLANGDYFAGNFFFFIFHYFLRLFTLLLDVPCFSYKRVALKKLLKVQIKNMEHLGTILFVTKPGYLMQYYQTQKWVSLKTNYSLTYFLKFLIQHFHSCFSLHSIYSCSDNFILHLALLFCNECVEIQYTWNVSNVSL